jgi:AsmA protein
MHKPLKIGLIALVVCAGTLILLVGITALALRAHAKPRLERLASEALGMPVHINGAVGISFFPGLHLAVKDVHAGAPSAELASAAQIDLGIALLPLLHDQIQADQIVLRGAAVALARDRSGKLNFDTAPMTRGGIPALSITTLSVADATFSYKNAQSGADIGATNCDLDVSHLQFAPLAFTATLGCGRIQTRDFDISALRSTLRGREGVVTVSPITMRLLGAEGAGDIRADFTGAAPAYQLHYQLPRFRLEDFFGRMAPKSIGHGAVDFAANLSLRGSSADALVASAQGVATLHGSDLTLTIGDLDAKIARYKSSQSFNLVDFGAFFFAGPLGLAVTRSYDYARMLEGAQGTSSIRTLASEWEVEHGIAQATDVAMATQKNRIALKGGLNFVSGRYDEVVVAVVDTEGCPIVEQKVDGTFLHPVLEKPNVVVTITGPVRTLMRETGHLFGRKCTAFYAGSVAAPK